MDIINNIVIYGGPREALWSPAQSLQVRAQAKPLLLLLGVSMHLFQLYLLFTQVITLLT